MGEGYGVGDLDGRGGSVLAEAAEEETVDGGGGVLEGVEDELYVGDLGDLVTAVRCHLSIFSLSGAKKKAEGDLLWIAWPAICLIRIEPDGTVTQPV